MRPPAAAVLRSVSWACPGRTDAKNLKKSSKDNPRVQAWMTTVSQFIFFRSKTDLVYRHEWLCRSDNGHGGSILTPQAENKNCQISWYLFHVEDAIVAREHICSLCNVDNPRVQAWMTTVSQFKFSRPKTDLVYMHEWPCRSGNGHGGSILMPQAENKNCRSVGTCSTWKMQSWLENTSVAFAMCIVRQSRSRYRLYV